MVSLLKALWVREAFRPTMLIGIWLNPFFIIRRSLLKGITDIALYLSEGKLLDFGCGSKPYESLFKVDEYIGIDIKISGHNHIASSVDKFYDGEVIPFPDAYFDNVFSSEVFEHVFNIDEILDEINRVLRLGGKLGFTCPFVWDEHEQPYDYARYTKFAIEHLLNKHGFELIKFEKSTGYVETIAQMFSAYLWQYVLPRNVYVRFLLVPFIIAPVNLMGIFLGFILPSSDSFYHNNIVVAKKIAESISKT